MLSLFLRLTKEKLILFFFSDNAPTHPPAGSSGSSSSTRSPDFHPLPFIRCKLRDQGFEGAGDGSGPLSTAPGGPRSPRQPPQQPPPLSGAGFSCKEAKRSCFPGSARLVAETVLHIPFKTTGVAYLPSALRDSQPPSTTPSQGGSRACSF